MAESKLSHTYRMENHKKIITKSFFLICLLLCSATYAFDESSDGWLPINSENGTLVLNVKINGHPANILLDTGASIHTLSSSIAEKTGIKGNSARAITLIGVNGKVKAPLSAPFDIVADGQKFTLRDIPILEGNSSYGMILGRDFFEQSVVQIDYPNNRIRFLSSEIVNFESNIDVRYEYGGGLLVEAYIAGEKAWMLLDTGSNTLALLKRKFIFKNDLDQYVLEGITHEVSGIAESAQFNVIKVEEFRLGTYDFDSFLALYNQDYKNSFDEKKKYLFSRIPEESSIQDGILGYDILRNFVVTIDYKRKKVHLYFPSES